MEAGKGNLHLICSLEHRVPICVRAMRRVWGLTRLFVEFNGIRRPMKVEQRWEMTTTVKV